MRWPSPRSGAITSRALLVGLAYTLLWEGVLAGLLEGTRYLSIRQATLGVAAALTGADVGVDPLAPVVAIAIVVVAIVGGFVVADPGPAPLRDARRRLRYPDPRLTVWRALSSIPVTRCLASHGHVGLSPAPIRGPAGRDRRVLPDASRRPRGRAHRRHHRRLPRQDRPRRCAAQGLPWGRCRGRAVRSRPASSWS